MKRSLVSASLIKTAIRDGISELPVAEHSIITDEARDLAARHKITLKRVKLAEFAREDNVSQEQRSHIAIGADHGGYELKERLRLLLEQSGYTVFDAGCAGNEAVDYPDYASRVANAVSRGEAARGIMIDTIGVASAMVCNRFKGVRAAACESMKSALSSRRHNNANVLTFGAGILGVEEAEEIVLAWIKEPFDGGRHQKRVLKIMSYDKTS
jgi:ribose 5-phosphate isomerase B